MRLWSKLASRRGETLTETLVGVLIVGLSSAVLACMVAASARMNSAAVAADSALYEAVTKAEGGEPAGGGTAEVAVTVTVGGESHTFSSALCGDGDVPLYSYRYEKGGGAPST